VRSEAGPRGCARPARWRERPLGPRESHELRAHPRRGASGPPTRPARFERRRHSDQWPDGWGPQVPGARADRPRRRRRRAERRPEPDRPNAERRLAGRAFAARGYGPYPLRRPDSAARQCRPGSTHGAIRTMPGRPGCRSHRRWRRRASRHRPAGTLAAFTRRHSRRCATGILGAAPTGILGAAPATGILGASPSWHAGFPPHARHGSRRARDTVPAGTLSAFHVKRTHGVGPRQGCRRCRTACDTLDSRERPASVSRLRARAIGHCTAAVATASPTRAAHARAAAPVSVGGNGVLLRRADGSGGFNLLRQVSDAARLRSGPKTGACLARLIALRGRAGQGRHGLAACRAPDTRAKRKT
jgi:hypothetical protein